MDKTHIAMQVGGRRSPCRGKKTKRTEGRKEMMKIATKDGILVNRCW